VAFQDCGTKGGRTWERCGRASYVMLLGLNTLERKKRGVGRSRFEGVGKCISKQLGDSGNQFGIWTWKTPIHAKHDRGQSGEGGTERSAFGMERENKR